MSKRILHVLWRLTEKEYRRVFGLQFLCNSINFIPILAVACNRSFNDLQILRRHRISDEDPFAIVFFLDLGVGSSFTHGCLPSRKDINANRRTQSFCASVSGTTRPRARLMRAYASSASMPARTSVHAARSDARPMPARQWMTTLRLAVRCPVISRTN